MQTSGVLLADSVSGNIVLLGLAVLGLLSAAILVGTAHLISTEQRDPLSRSHTIDL